MKKKILITLAVLFTTSVAGAFIIPIIFKDDIRKIVDEQIKNNINAEVYFDDNTFSLSIFKNFPDLTLTLQHFGIVGKGDFQEDTLIDVSTFSASIDLWSLLKGIEIKSILIDTAKIKVKVLEDGRSNYDITFSDTILSQETEINKTKKIEETEEDSDFNIAIKNWSISHTDILYNDKSLDFYTNIKNFNHKGSGDFSLKFSNLLTKTSVDEIKLDFEGVNYLNKNTFQADIAMAMDLKNNKYIFKENFFQLNDLGLSFDGFIQLLEQGYEMDFGFKAPDTKFRHILSLVPAIFLEGFEDLKTKGVFSLDGRITGVYDDIKNIIPGVDIKLEIDKGFFQYPNLPTAIEHINLKSQIILAAGDFDEALKNMLLNVEKFHINFGQNPVEFQAKIKGYPKSYVQADADAHLDIASLTTMFPIDSLIMKGIFDLNAKIDGVYDSLKSLIPKLDIDMLLKDGYIKYESYAIPIEDINMTATIKNTNSKLNDTRIDLVSLGAMIEGKPLKAEGHIYNLNDAIYEFDLKGVMDLALVPELIDLDGTELSGKVQADINTKGRMSYITQERYQKLPTKGQVKITNLNYKSEDLPQGFSIVKSNLIFNPKEIKFADYQGTVGKSDINLKGGITNYIAYIFSDYEILKGNLRMRSKKMDINEWIVETEDREEEKEVVENQIETDTFYSSVLIPQNIDIIFSVDIQSIDYENFDVNNFRGTVKVKNGTAYLKNTDFDMLGGKFTLSGSYDTKDEKKPKFDFKSTIKNLSIAKAYNNFNTIRVLAPIAQDITGYMDFNFNINGTLDEHLNPIYEVLDLDGLLSWLDVSLQNSAIFQKLSDITKIKAFANPSFKDVTTYLEIREGKLYVKPFDIKFGDIISKVQGHSSITGEIVYELKTQVPVNYLVNPNLAQQYTELTGSTTLPIPITIVGTYKKPKITFDQNFKVEIENAVKAKLKDKTKEEVKDILDKVLSGDKQELEKKAKEASDKLKGLFGKKKKKNN